MRWEYSFLFLLSACLEAEGERAPSASPPSREDKPLVEEEIHRHEIEVDPSQDSNVIYNKQS